MTVEVFAPAKVNLTLHVTGRRPDGYHTLDSLVAFVGIGDTVRVEKADRTSLAVTGAFADRVPPGEDNLVLRAAGLVDAPAAITLDKRLPPASGVGGGSADAAATIRAICALHDLAPPDPRTLLSLGADVPVCMSRGVVRMRGIGEDIRPLTDDFVWPCLLVNPGVPVPTRDVFARLATPENAAMTEPLYDPAFFEFPDWLATQRNDLEAAAIKVAPEIADVLGAIRAEPGCRFARMSGSGATCFGLFDVEAEARAAATEIGAAHPDWWVTAT